MKFLEIFIFLFYACWMFFSLLAQGETPVNQAIKRWDIFNLIPNYHFFCPSPTTEDYHLYIRHQLANESWDEWFEPTIGQRNLWICYIWNPRKRSRKIFQRTARVLKKAYTNKKKRYGPMYLLVLNYVKHTAPPNRYIATQFKITSKQNLVPDAVESIIFLSPSHKLS